MRVLLAICMIVSARDGGQGWGCGRNAERGRPDGRDTAGVSAQSGPAPTAFAVAF